MNVCYVTSILKKLIERFFEITGITIETIDLTEVTIILCSKNSKINFYN